MRPNAKYLYDKFDYFNNLCFSGKLKRPEIRLNTRLDSVGLTRMISDPLTGEREIWIEISVRKDLPEEEYIDTLLHEMIHYYIISFDITDDAPHGTRFQSEMNRIINDYGFRITLNYTPDEETLANTRSRLRYFCVVRFNDGDTCISVVVKNNLFRFWDASYKLESASDVKWYVSDREILGRFPISAQFAFYSIRPEKLPLYLTGARELIKDGNTIRTID